MGRVGVITHRERHDGGFNIVHIKDAIDNSFATRESNVFIIGKEKPWVSLPKGKGVKVRLIYAICKGSTNITAVVDCRGERPKKGHAGCWSGINVSFTLLILWRRLWGGIAMRFCCSR